MASFAPLISQVRSKLVGAHGPDGLHMAYTQLQGVSSLREARAVLARLSARILDEHFAALEAAGFNVADLIKAVSDDAISVARRIVVDAAWSMLVTAAVADSLSPGVAAPNPADVSVSASVLLERFDASRFTDVCSGAVTEAQAIAEFAAAFPDPDAQVSPAEFVSYCAGVSECTPDSKEFQLKVVRSWNLDRRGMKALALADADITASGSAARRSMGRAHPLYQTASMTIGKGAALAPEVAVRKWNRTGAFTKENPSPSPSCGLNTSATKGRFM
jgi:hypothetical protein